MLAKIPDLPDLREESRRNPERVQMVRVWAVAVSLEIEALDGGELEGIEVGVCVGDVMEDYMSVRIEEGKLVGTEGEKKVW